ncbi:MAG: hypothetical protein BWK76_27455 [Desulfobulbaceae bacterium A2]|nr:MAG: hypothetical protein BWK76_27455 [Desulfobulbaceae bacterium A2]
MTVETLLPLLWHQLGWPLLRLLIFISLGLLVANLIESLNWTEKMAALARPFTRWGRLSPTAGASFSLSFFSSLAANTMLAEAYDQGRMTRQELICASLLNTLPTYVLHLPTTFFIAAPLIGRAALPYLGLTLGAALLRSMVVLLLGRVILPRHDHNQTQAPARDAGGTVGLRAALDTSWLRFRRRIGKVLRFTLPVYLLFFLLQRLGIFGALERSMAEHLAFLSWLSPQAMSIVMLQLVAEFTAGVAAAGALLQDGLSQREVVLALLAGNILSSPIRAIRHQFPYYAGIFPPRLALELIVYSQGFRAVSMMLVTAAYLL